MCVPSRKSHRQRASLAHRLSHLIIVWLRFCLSADSEHLAPVTPAKKRYKIRDAPCNEEEKSDQTKLFIGIDSLSRVAVGSKLHLVLYWASIHSSLASNFSPFRRIIMAAARLMATAVNALIRALTVVRTMARNILHRRPELNF
jgi:hypothetical protein